MAILLAQAYCLIRQAGGGPVIGLGLDVGRDGNASRRCGGNGDVPAVDDYQRSRERSLRRPYRARSPGRRLSVVGVAAVAAPVRITAG
jgi:hypothetical protein